MAAGVVRLINNSLAPRTKAAYQHGVNKFVAFCNELELDETDRWPPSDPTVAGFIAWMADEGNLEEQTIRSYLSALGKHLKLYHGCDGDLPLASRPLSKMCLQGLARERGQDPNRKPALERDPITIKMFETLEEKLPPLDRRTFEQKLVLAGMYLCFAGGFRAAEILPCDGDIGLPIKFLTPCDEHFQPTSVERATQYSAFLHKSKGDRQFVGDTVPVSWAPAVQAISQYLLLRPASSELAPVLLTRNGEALSRQSFVNMFRGLLTQAGVPGTERLFGHSFRKGFAQTLRDDGHDDTTIQLGGRWSSGAHRLYHKDKLERRAEVNRSLGQKK